MNKVRFAFLPVVIWVALGGAVFAEGKLPFYFTPACSASVEFGDIVKGHDKNVGEMDNVWMNKTIIGLGAQVIFRSVDTFRVAAEMKMFNEYPRYDLGASRRLYYYPYIKEAQVIHSFANNDMLSLVGGIGYFSFKYNSDVRNLGEYLFRSTVYPQTLSTEFDFPFARLLGGYLTATLFNQLRIDILISSNQEYMAVDDINGSILGTWKPGRIFEIGGGVSFCSLIPADLNATTPKMNISSAYIDTMNGKPDTQFYTFAGTKLMARMSLDPKLLFTSDGFGGFLGEKDLRLYTEAALLGTDNYPRAFKSPVWYMNPLERVPVMFGLTWPTNPLLTYISPVVPAALSYFLDPDHNFSKNDMVRLSATGGAGLVVGTGLWFLEKKLAKKLRFDEVSIEAEYWGNPYPNSQQGIVLDGLPLPFRSGTGTIQDSLMYKHDNWKWSIYAKKTFSDHFYVTIQAASDHMRTFALDWDRQDWEESLRGPSNWYYVVKLGAMF